MAFFPKTLTALALAASITLPVQAFALDDQQKKELGEFIKQYLIENPEIMLDVQDALQKKQQMAQQVKATMAIENNNGGIFDSKDDVTLGNPKGDVTVVEFFDYNCTYCRHALPDMQALLKKDRNVRFEDEPHVIAKLPDHDLWMAFARDSEGNVFALMSEVKTG